MPTLPSRLTIDKFRIAQTLQTNDLPDGSGSGEVPNAATDSSTNNEATSSTHESRLTARRTSSSTYQNPSITHLNSSFTHQNLLTSQQNSSSSHVDFSSIHKKSLLLNGISVAASVSLAALAALLFFVCREKQ